MPARGQKRPPCLLPESDGGDGSVVFGHITTMRPMILLNGHSESRFPHLLGNGACLQSALSKVRAAVERESCKLAIERTNGARNGND
jgi:hypothetical protein